MKCDRRWWNDGALDRALDALKAENDERARLFWIRERLAALAHEIRDIGTMQAIGQTGDAALALRVVVVVEGLAGTINRRGGLDTLLGVSSDEDSFRTAAILKAAADAAWRVDHVQDPRRLRTGR